RARDFIRSIIDAAGQFGASAIVGSMQGRWGDVPRDAAISYVAEALNNLGEHAKQYRVPLLYEPLNRYETNIVSTNEGRIALPKILEVLARAGHHGRVLIADGNYPASSTLGPNAELVSLNLSPGIVTCTQVLEALVSAIPIEEANTMAYETTGPYALREDPPVW